MEEGRKMFSIFAARMFEQRVLNAYREKVAAERQEQLLRELADEDKIQAEREAKRAKENQKKKDKKKQQKQAKEAEKAKKDAEKAAEEVRPLEIFWIHRLTDTSLCRRLRKQGQKLLKRRPKRGKKKIDSSVSKSESRKRRRKLVK